MSSLTIFTWGYSGWGNATREFVQVVDAVERDRGYHPPVFVDIRIRRTVRAAGFQGRAFEHLVGLARHHWIKSLGNSYIETRTGPSIQIADPTAARDLLDLAVRAAEQGRRLVTFCGCQFPRQDEQPACHRETVAGLVLTAASKAGIGVEIIEWPGGDPTHVEVSVSPATVAALVKGRVSVPLGDDVSPDVRCLPWGSVVSVRGEGQGVEIVSGPAFVDKHGARLPVFERFTESIPKPQQLKQLGMAFRRSRGLEARRTLG